MTQQKFDVVHRGLTIFIGQLQFRFWGPLRAKISPKSPGLVSLGTREYNNTVVML